MPYRALRRTPADRVLRPADWELLVRLPGRVLVAATVAGPAVTGDGVGAATTGPPAGDGAAPRTGDPVAGLDAIAAGRSSPSDVVAGVVAAIFAELAGDGDAGEFADPQAGTAAVLADARTAARTLARRATGADAAAYRYWLLDIAAAGCGRPPTLGGRRFQVDLTLALSG